MPDINSLAIKKILIIDLAFIGDVVLATPVTRALRQKWPQAEITMLTVPLTSSVAAMNPYVDQVLVYDKKNEYRGWSGMWKMAQKLRQYQFDLAVCMNFALRGALVSFLARIPYRLGYDAQWAGMFLTWASDHHRQGLQHETRNHLEVFKAWGWHPEDTSLVLSPAQEVQQSYGVKAQALALEKQKYWVLCPFGSYGRKNMPTALGVQLIRTLEESAPVYLIGGAGEKAGLEAFAKAGHIADSRVQAGTLTLPELALFLQGARALVGVDTGPMHIAQAVQCPTIALFGPTDPKVWGPENSNSHIIYLANSCSPCWGKGKCQQHNSCMKNIKAQDVLEALKLVGENNGNI